MAGVAGSVRVVSVVVLVCGCGGNAGVDSVRGPSGGSGSASGGSAQDSGGAASAGAGSGGSAQGGGGDSGAATKQCKTIDGQLSYGPIGEPWAWPLATVSASSGDCYNCSQVEGFSGFRSAAGFGFVWRTGIDWSAPSPNLFGMTVGPNFEGGKPRALLTKNAVRDLDIAVAPNGFVVTTCSLESKPEWISLNDELDVASSPGLVAPDAPCEYAPGILWTGQRYLTSFTDARGLVVASLDEQGTLVGEEILSAEVDTPVMARFSRNGDRVLFVFNQRPGQQGRYGMLDLQGRRLGDTQAIGDESVETSRFAVVANRDSWWVLNGSSVANDTSAVLTRISRDGLAEREERAFGYLSLGALTPSAYGGARLVGSRSEGGPFAHSFALMALVDDAGGVVYSREKETGDAAGPWPDDVVVDPLRDLVVERRVLNGSKTTRVVQEYGCLE